MPRAGYKLLLLKERQIRFGTTPLAVSVLPGWGNPKAAGCWHLGGHIGHAVLPLFLGFLLNYLLLATAEKADWVKWPLGVLQVWPV